MESGLIPPPEYAGSCHCGAVQFRIAAAITDIYRCDCSLCRMKGALMTSVHEDAFTLLTGADKLSQYNWNTRRCPALLLLRMRHLSFPQEARDAGPLRRQRELPRRV